MSHGLFGGSISTEVKPIVTARRTSRANSLSFNNLRRASHQGSISQTHEHTLFINEALAEARTSLAEGGIPTGCVLVRQGQIVARGHNRRLQRGSAILHAEMDCLESLGRKPAAFYHECTLYLTASPCSMCAGAIRFYGIPRVVIGDHKLFHGDEALLRASNVYVDELDCPECHELLDKFIKENPAVWQEDTAHNA